MNYEAAEEITESKGRWPETQTEGKKGESGDGYFSVEAVWSFWNGVAYYFD